MHNYTHGQRPLFGRSGLGAQSDLIGMAEPMGIASALPAPKATCSRASWCLLRKVTGTGPHGRVLSTLRSAGAAVVRPWSAVREPVLPHLLPRTVHRPADGINNECFAEYQGVLAGSLLP
jgi:hypothetical protein